MGSDGNVAVGGMPSLDLVGRILGTRTFLVAVLKEPCFGLKMTTVSSMVVVKSTKPTYVTLSRLVLLGLMGFPNL